jgi:hypothetical protein
MTNRTSGGNREQRPREARTTEVRGARQTCSSISASDPLEEQADHLTAHWWHDDQSPDERGVLVVDCAIRAGAIVSSWADEEEPDDEPTDGERYIDEQCRALRERWGSHTVARATVAAFKSSILSPEGQAWVAHEMSAWLADATAPRVRITVDRLVRSAPDVRVADKRFLNPVWVDAVIEIRRCLRALQAALTNAQRLDLAAPVPPAPGHQRIAIVKAVTAALGFSPSPRDFAVLGLVFGLDEPTQSENKRRGRWKIARHRALRKDRVGTAPG